MNVQVANELIKPSVKLNLFVLDIEQTDHRIKRTLRVLEGTF